MPHTKSTASKKKIKPVVREPAEEAEEALVAPIEKIKKIPDLEIHDDVAGLVDEKPEVDPLLAEEETDENAAEEALDDEEINPFGDKWEE